MSAYFLKGTLGTLAPYLIFNYFYISTISVNLLIILSINITILPFFLRIFCFNDEVRSLQFMTMRGNEFRIKSVT